jgi:hypothetical protein
VDWQNVFVSLILPLIFLVLACLLLAGLVWLCLRVQRWHLAVKRFRLHIRDWAGSPALRIRGLNHLLRQMGQWQWWHVLPRPYRLTARLAGQLAQQRRYAEVTEKQSSAISATGRHG